MNTKIIVAVLIAIVLTVLAVKLVDRRDEPRKSDIGNSLEDVGDNIKEGLDDAGRKIEDAVD